MSASDWKIRPATSDELPWVAASLAEELDRNSYFHAVPKQLTEHLARCVARAGWECMLVTTVDEDEPAGWVVFERTPVLTVAMAFVEPSYRGLGAWVALRGSIGLREGQLVNVVLAGPQAMGLARKKYMAKHSYGRLLEWLT